MKKVTCSIHQVKRKNSSRILLLELLFIICCIQNIAIISFESFSIKPYHIVAIHSLPYLARRKIILPDKNILIFAGIVVVVSCYNIIGYGIDSFLLNYIFAFYFLVFVYNFGKDISEQEWIAALKKCAVILMILVWVKNMYYIRIFWTFFERPYGHPEVMTFFGGGVNLEATYIGMLTPVFFKGNIKNKCTYLFFSTLLSTIYVSRTALIVNLICWLWVGYSEIKTKKWSNVFVLLILGAIALLTFIERGSTSYIFERILSLKNLGIEAGAKGRLDMWKYIWSVFCNRPLGVGIGNSIKIIRDISGVAFKEDNLHNIYFQMFVDLGIVGGLYYLIIIVRFVKKEWRMIYQRPIASILMLYVISSFLQFRGAESFIYLILGVYFRISKDNLLPNNLTH